MSSKWMVRRWLYFPTACGRVNRLARQVQCSQVQRVHRGQLLQPAGAPDRACHQVCPVPWAYSITVLPSKALQWQGIPTVEAQDACRKHRLDDDRAMWVPRDIRFKGYQFPDSNINAGVFLMAKRAYSTVRQGRMRTCRGHASLLSQ